MEAKERRIEYEDGRHVDITFNEAAHIYTKTLNGAASPVPGVTTILGVLDKPALTGWKVRQAVEFLVSELTEDERHLSDMNAEQRALYVKAAKRWPNLIGREAADVGTMVHEYCEHMLSGNVSVAHAMIDEEADETAFHNAVEAFNKFLDENEIEVGWCERIIHHIDENYCGTCDLMARLNGKPMLLDFKTSPVPYEAYWMQLAAYYEAYIMEADATPPSELGILCLNKETAEYSLHTIGLGSNEYAWVKYAWGSVRDYHRAAKALSAMGFWQ